MVKIIRLGEFFSGPGGIAKGAHLAAEDESVKSLISLRHEWAYDIDSDSCQTYIKNIPRANEQTVFNEDVTKFLEPQVASELNEIDGFAFGFPCNDFSLVGQHKGLNGTFGGLYKTGVAVLKAKQPRWFIAENVGGLRSANGGKAFNLIVDELRESGYTVISHLYKFEEYGVPQARHRVIIVGIRNDLDAAGINFKVPEPTHTSPINSRKSNLKPFTTSSEALNKDIPEGTKHLEETKHTETVRRRLALIGPGENAFTAADKFTDELKLNVKGATISQIYKKLDPGKPAYTVTGSGGGGTHMYHWKYPRALTNRERARLQTFPDNYNFAGKKDSVRKQIGMAVPVEGARVLFLAIFKSLLGIEYGHIRPNLR